ncbi:bifunctional adenosylcobinamide kinase/adenosylcobinamide-phosphate guanylyltransferase [Spirochaetia bacterium 38H-sp]|uniref:Adenosylcobinamide kinase n=1 Tax=Rarispira pelagica TaxID=3141764 RepID=A0ABU9UCL0_9SPIR
MEIFLVTGGARSGKSRFCIEKANSHTGRRVFIATAEALDEEMTERIIAHRAERGDSWETIEEPLKLADAISNAAGYADVVVADCLTLWLSNLCMSMLKPDKEYVISKINELTRTLAKVKARGGYASIFMVSNEVGCGIVPVSNLGRFFRDMAGMLNQRVAEVADNVVLMAAGLPIYAKKDGLPVFAD